MSLEPLSYETAIVLMMHCNSYNVCDSCDVHVQMLVMSGMCETVLPSSTHFTCSYYNGIWGFSLLIPIPGTCDILPLPNIMIL